jgi:hypothetical protein
VIGKPQLGRPPPPPPPAPSHPILAHASASPLYSPPAHPARKAARTRSRAATRAPVMDASSRRGLATTPTRSCHTEGSPPGTLSPVSWKPPSSSCTKTSSAGPPLDSSPSIKDRRRNYPVALTDIAATTFIYGDYPPKLTIHLNRYQNGPSFEREKSTAPTPASCVLNKCTITWR